MPVLPASLALTVIPDGSPIIAADHRNNYGAVQTGVNALIAILDNGNGVDGDPLVWDATNAKWSAASRLPAGRPRPARVTTSLMSGGPPASPVDGDIWIATAVNATGARWQFQYNAGSGSASKWEFIGGSPLISEVQTSEATASVARVDLATVQSLTIPRSGDYAVSVSMTAYNATAAPSVIQGAATRAGVVLVDLSLGVSTAGYAIPTSARLNQTLVAADIVKQQYSASAGTGNFFNRSLQILPVRIA